jgi:NAD(P)-dependent dehydrogenase (short-subunit alcohol dehydrogenase family)
MTDPIFDIENRTIVLTGACGLIGRKLAEEFLARGAKLVLADLEMSDPAGLATLLNEKKAGYVYGKSCDVARSEEVASLVEYALEKCGRVDVLINSHQYKPKGFLVARAEEFPEELWDSIIGANLKGTFLTCRDFGKIMLQQGKGSIINFASTYGVVSSNPALYENNSLGNPLAYSASKGGVIMLTKYLGAYWAKGGVRVNCLTPHGVWNNHEEAFVERFSKMSPMGRLMKVDETVGAALFLASDASSYVTGTNLLVEGGWTAW